MKTGCCICGGVINKHYTPEGEMYWDKGHNPYPIAVDVNGDAIDIDHEDYRCCDVCNSSVVIPARMVVIPGRESRWAESANPILRALGEEIQQLLAGSKQ